MMMLSTVIFIVFVSIFHINYLVAHMAISGLMLSINFLLQRWFVFRKG